MSRVVLVVGVAVLLSAAPVSAWRVRLLHSRPDVRIALDRTGAVFAALDVPPHSGAGGNAATLVKVDAAGRLRWRRRFRGRGRVRLDFLQALRTMDDGDILVAGTVYDDGRPMFLVTRLGGRNGAVRWQADVHGQPQPDGDAASALALAPDGDVVVAGGLAGISRPHLLSAAIDFAVVKLSAKSGEERWRFTLDGSAEALDEARAVAVDAAGNVIAVGEVTEGLPSDVTDAPTVTIIKLAADDGHMLWRRDIDAARVPYDVVIDGAGDIFIPIAARDATGDRFAVMKLSGASGEPLWTARLLGIGAQHYWDEARKAAVVPSGGIAAVGITTDEAGSPALAAVLLDAETGAERWHQLLQGNDGYGLGRDLAVMPNGDVVVGGQFRNRRSCYDLAFARLAAATGKVRERRSLDGTTIAPCDAVCLHGSCTTPPRAGLDQDTLSALAVDDHGRVVVAGVVSDGYYGRRRGIVVALPRRRRGTASARQRVSP